MKTLKEVLRLRHEHGASVREIAAACNIGRTTVSEYLAKAKTLKLSCPEAAERSEDELSELLSTAAGSEELRPLPDWNDVRRQLARKGVTLTLLWQEYRARFPQGYSYSRYARFYKRWLKDSDLRMLQIHKAGQKMFADWAGLSLNIVNAATGEIRQAPVFVSAMGLSQYTFAKAFETQELRWWLAAHVNAFQFYGALPEIVVPDNLKTGVQKPCRYDPALNPAYAEFARFYKIAVLPARVRKPRDKAKVENAVQQIERWVLAPLRDRLFFSIEEANEAMAEKLADLNDKVMKGPELSRKQLFESEDKPAMRSLPETHYAHAEWKRVKVAPDYHVEVEGHLYSVPFTHVGQNVDVRASAGTIEVFAKGARIASHLRCVSRRGHTTDPLHMPERHRRQAEWTPERVMRWAATIGPNTSALAESFMCGKVHPEHGFRLCMGLISLEKRFEKERVEAACAKALALGAISYQSVKSILHNNLENLSAAPDLAPLPNHHNVRGGSYYASEEAVCARSR